MKRFFTVTSPDNALAVAIYCMLTFYGLVFLLGTPSGPVRALGHLWSTVLLVASSAAAWATLYSPRRRDPDQSLIVEYWSSVTLCILMCWLEVSLLWYHTESGQPPFITAGVGLIFIAGFGFRAHQIKQDRKSLAKYRRDHGPTVK